MHSCPNCNYEIKNRYIGSQNNPSRIKCPKCRKKLEVTKLSAIIYMVATIIPVILATIFIKNTPIRIILILLWVVLSLRTLRPVMYKFEIEKK